MPAPNQSERINGLVEATLRLEENLGSFRRDLEKVQEFGSNIRQLELQNAQVSGRIDLLALDLGRVKDDLKELKAIRWEIWKMILTPLISALLSAIVSGVVASIVMQKSPGPVIEQSPRSPAKRP